MKNHLYSLLYFVVAISLIACDTAIDKKEQLVDFISEDDTEIFRFQNLDRLLTDVKSNPVLSHYKDLPSFQFFKDNATVLSLLKPSSESILTFQMVKDSVQSFSFITKNNDSVFSIDSTATVERSIVTAGKNNIQVLKFPKHELFSAVKDSFLIVSNAKDQVEKLLTGNTTVSSELRRLFRLNEEAELSVFTAATAMKIGDTIRKMGEWRNLNTQLRPDGFTATGVINIADSTSVLSLLKGQNAAPITLKSIIPKEFKTATLLTINDVEAFINQTERGNKPLTDVGYNLISSFHELGFVQTETGASIIAKSVDPALSLETIIAASMPLETYRDVSLYELQNEVTPFINATKLLPCSTCIVYFQWDDYFVFSESLIVAQEYIADLKNSAILGSSNSFADAAIDLNSASSLTLLYSDEEASTSMQSILGVGLALKEKKALNKFPLFITQFVMDGNYANMNVVFKEFSKGKTGANDITERFHKVHPETLLSSLYFFENQKSRSQNIVFQDITNALNLYSDSGSLLWSRDLDTPILGEITEVDSDRNGKRQMVFVTDNALYMIDRNGKDVAPFPINFKDEVTQPLAVYDYDNTRRYRFAVTQKNNVLLYNAAGKAVDGFKFKRTKSAIIQPPQHIRLGSKDYLTVQEDDGTLHLLSRTGNTRVPVGEKFKFFKSPILSEKSNFILKTEDQKIATVTQKGAVTFIDAPIKNIENFSILKNTRVTLDDNLLRIKGTLIELPFGLYTAPRSFLIKGKVYVTVTDTQEKKVYLFGPDRKLLDGFPVYGTGKAQVTDHGNKKFMAVLGTENEVILYEF